MLCFITTESEETVDDYLTQQMEVEAKGLIIAGRRSDLVVVSGNMIMISIDYGQGTTMLNYIKSTRYLFIYTTG